jgi:aryl-alcohol dehydrogenase-like predicted oxidoreductase
MRYKLLGRSGVRVSELCLGTMTFGEDWGWGASKEDSRRIFDIYADAGGNFIDTSVNYTDGTSEAFVGEFLEGQRDKFVVATKYTLSTDQSHLNGGGNSRKAMIQSVEKSLKRLRTDYIDLYYLHMWDQTTPVDEFMRGFDDLVRAGKIVYCGVSDTPAWVVSRANTMADLMGWSPFVALQISYSLANRDVERDLLPMAKALDLAVLPWGIMGGGVLTGKYNTDSGEPRRYDNASERAKKIAETVMEIANETGRSAAQVAITWVRQQQQRANVIPILGARTENQIRDNLAVLDFELSAEHLKRIEDASPFTAGFPHDFLKADNVQKLINGDKRAAIVNHRGL